MIEGLAYYGIISAKVFKDKKLSNKAKLTYAILAAKQGCSDYAELNMKMIAEVIGGNRMTVYRSVKKLIEQSYLKRLDTYKYDVSSDDKGQYGMIEVGVLISTEISWQAKYLYCIYCIVSGDDETNTWSRDGICSQFRMSNTTYYDAKKELDKHRLLFTSGRVSQIGKQTSNLNKILRLKACKLKLPLESWLSTTFVSGDVLFKGQVGHQSTTIESSVSPEYAECITRVPEVYHQDTTNNNPNNNPNNNHSEKTTNSNDLRIVMPNVESIF